MKYEVVMGLEVHVELAAESKLFCACSAKFGAEPNENVCPACAGMPGSPPSTNKRAIELGIAAGLVTNCEIATVTTFDKKNYFYPDLPTGYQITQLYAPICKNGSVEVVVPTADGGFGVTLITLKQIHIEQDAGKLVHDARAGASLVDFNRAGVPLIEIVSNPDFRTADEVVAYLEKLRSLLSFAGISDCKMQEGSMRCDVNLSVRELGAKEYGVRTEMKNLNSLKAIAAAIAFEAQRHIDALESDETIIQETRRWDDNLGESLSMRGKEDEADYRYFPDPEIPPVHISKEWIEEVRKSLPEPAHIKYQRMTEELGLPEYDSKIITGSKNLSDLFDKTLKYINSPKEIANWIIVELLAIAKGDNKGEDDVHIDCEKFAKLIELVDNKTVNRNTGKKILLKVFEDSIDPVAYVEENQLGMVSDTATIDAAVDAALSQNEKSVREYKDGSEKVLGFLVGQVMRNMGGKADPKLVNERLLEALRK
jgi:aspartyl-tRNA(Asn)/glutamyl-tRNA(Gln) amidotransferase subunit B